MDPNAAVVEIPEEEAAPKGVRASERASVRASARPRRASWPIRFVGSILGLIILTVVVLGTTAAVSYYTVVHYIRGHAVEVPNLTSRTVSQALEEVGPLGLSLAFDESEFNDTVPEGAILRQRPRPGHQAKKGTPIYVTLSRGPQLTAVPEVVGLSLNDARMVLNQNDLAVGETSHMHSATVPQETVIAQSPPPGDGLRVGQKVQLLVSMGPEQTVYAAPNLTGLTLPETAPVLQPLGCTIGKVTERDAPPGVVRGTVLDQSPAPGAPLQRGGTVDVVIARRL